MNGAAYVTTKKGQVAHLASAWCGALNTARGNGNVVPVPTEYARANLLPCTQCVTPDEWRRFRRWAA
jgi:hypothetical protein